MASIEKYSNDKEVLYQLKHDFRASPFPPRNTEIEPDLTKNNYIISQHGADVKECLEYYKSLLSNSYIYGKGSKREITRCLQWSIQAPDDLEPSQKTEFFKACYEFCNSLYGEENCIAAIVHTDEIMISKNGKRISHDHLHYLAVPRVANNKYISIEEKFEKGISALMKNGIISKFEDIETLKSIINQSYGNKTNKNDLISKIAKSIDCKYADAKKIYTTVVRKESEAHRMKINSDALTSRKSLYEFHPKLQAYLDNKGIKCTVSFKSQGADRSISYTVAEAKTVTKLTGLSIENIKAIELENAKLQEKVKALSQEISKSHEISKSSEWGSHSGWGKEKSNKWDLDY